MPFVYELYTMYLKHCVQLRRDWFFIWFVMFDILACMFYHTQLCWPRCAQHFSVLYEGRLAHVLFRWLCLKCTSRNVRSSTVQNIWKASTSMEMVGILSSWYTDEFTRFLLRFMFDEFKWIALFWWLCQLKYLHKQGHLVCFISDLDLYKLWWKLSNITKLLLQNICHIVERIMS